MRTSLWIAVLGLAPLLAGCDEYGKPDGAKAPEKTSEKGTEAKPKKPAADFAGFPPTDPMVAAAAQARDQMARQEEELLERLDALRGVLGSAKADPARIKESVEEFLRLAKDLRRITVQAGDAINAITDSAAELSRSMRHLGASYRSVASLFRSKARDYKEARLRDQMNAFADDLDSIAKSIPERMAALQTFQTILPKLKGKVGEANSFLDDAAMFLSSHPGIGSDPRERYAAQFESFAATFSEWLRTLDDLRNVLRSGALSRNIQESCRKERLALKRLEEERIEEARRRKEIEANRLRDEKAANEEAARKAQLADEERIAEMRQRLRLEIARAEQEKLETERAQAALERERLRAAQAASQLPQAYAPPSAAMPAFDSQSSVGARTVLASYPPSKGRPRTNPSSRVTVVPVTTICPVCGGVRVQLVSTVRVGR